MADAKHDVPHGGLNGNGRVRVNGGFLPTPGRDGAVIYILNRPQDGIIVTLSLVADNPEEGIRTASRAILAAASELGLDADSIVVEGNPSAKAPEPGRPDAFATQSNYLWDQRHGLKNIEAFSTLGHHFSDPWNRMETEYVTAPESGGFWHRYSIGVDAMMDDGLGAIAITHYFGPALDDHHTIYVETFEVNGLSLNTMRNLASNIGLAIENIEQVNLAPLYAALHDEDGEGDD